MGFMNGLINFFQDGGFFLYPLVIIFVVGVAISVERWLYLTIETSRNRSPVGRRRAASRRRQLQAGHHAREQLAGADRHRAEVRPRASFDGAPPRRHPAGDGRVAARDRAAPRETHALPELARQHRHAGRSARHHPRVDPRVRRGVAGEPGREGRAARRRHLRSHEQHGGRPRSSRSRCCWRTCSSRPRPPR